MVDGKCVMPVMKIGLSGDLSSLRVGTDPDTCEIVVKGIVERPTDGSTPSSQGTTGRSLPSVNYESRWVEALTKVVGINSIDDLTRTRTRTSVEFTRSPDVVFGGTNTATDCWGNHSIPPFFYYESSCNVNAFDFDGPASVNIRLKGVYNHIYDSAFDHWSTAKAEGTVTEDKATCAVGGLPVLSDLECELDYGLR